MAYDEALAARVRAILGRRRGLEEKRMFGGLAFLVNGRMCCGVVRCDLVVRVGPDAYERALTRRRARPMDFTGRPLRGMVYVGPEGCRRETSLRSWLDQAVGFVRTLDAPAGLRPGRARR